MAALLTLLARQNSVSISLSYHTTTGSLCELEPSLDIVFQRQPDNEEENVNLCIFYESRI